MAGYADPAHRGRKLARDLRLLRVEEAERPADPFTLFNLGSVLWEADGPAAVPYLERSLAGSHPQDSIVRKLYALLAQARLAAGDPAAALRTCDEGRGHYPADAELLFTWGQALHGRGEWAAAAACWRELIAGADGEHFGSVDAGLRGYTWKQGSLCSRCTISQTQ